MWRFFLNIDNIRSAKRSNTERRGVHSWHSYYAGYAEKFVEDALSVFAFPEAVVLDPWNGSGTTTFVAQRQGYCSIGIELNPVMVIHSRAKTLPCETHPDLLKSVTKVLNDAILRKSEIRIPNNGLNEWVIDQSTLKLLVSLRDAIFDLELCDEIYPSPTGIWQIQHSPVSVVRAFLLSGLFQLLRKVGNFKKGANPTWLTKTANNSIPKLDNDTVVELYRQIVETMLNHLTLELHPQEICIETWVQDGDVRKLPLHSETIDTVITSPPYLTRIDYTMATQPELLLLGYSTEEFDTLRRLITGAPVIVDKTIEITSTWGEECNRRLEQVANHHSKASRSYYLPLYRQYFRDMEVSLVEIMRVLKNGGKAVLVVQSSYYKEIEFDLGKMLIEMSRNIGFRGRRVRREKIRQHMAHVNTRSSKYKANKIYHEDVILLEKVL